MKAATVARRMRFEAGEVVLRRATVEMRYSSLGTNLASTSRGASVARRMGSGAGEVMLRRATVKTKSVADE